MGVKFAGARSVDDRRRRRIATEQEQPEAHAEKTVSRAGYLKIRRIEPGSQEPPRAPIASIIPPTVWKIWTACLLIPLGIGGLFLGGLFLQLPAHSALSDFVDFQQGQAWRFIRGIILLGCTALCWLISWFRSASVRDFEGCYKSWYWSGWIFLLLGLSAGTDAHLVASQVLRDYLRLEATNFFTLIWVVPMLALLIEPFRCFIREMWHCRRSWLVLCGSCLSGCLFLWARLENLPVQEYLVAENRQQLSAFSSILAIGFLLSALLSQTHYVMYVTSDPVPKRASWLLIGISRLNRFLGHAVSSVMGVTVGRFASTISRSKQSATDRKAARAQARQQKDAERAEQKRIKSEQLAAKQAEKQALQAQKQQRVFDQQEEKQRLADEKKAAQEQARLEKQAQKQQAAADRAAAKQAKLDEQAARAVQKQAGKTQPESTAEPTPVAQPDAPTSANEDRPELESSNQSRSTKPRVRIKQKPQRRQPDISEQEAELAELIPTRARKPTRQNADANSEPAHTLPLDSAEAEQTNAPADAGFEPIDPELLKGLSKKEKRRLRKLHRDQQRAKAG